MKKAILFLLVFSYAAFGESVEERLNRMDKELKEIREQLKKQKEENQKLKDKLKGKDSHEGHDHDSHKGHDHGSHKGHDHSKHGKSHGKVHSLLTPNKFMDDFHMSMFIHSVFGGSNKRNAVIEKLQGDGHSPDKRGAELQQIEFSIGGRVKGWDAEAHIVYSEDEVEVEEAFITSNEMPYGLELKIGYYFTEFGLMNKEHLHNWIWVDQPIVVSRMFGGEGMRGAGVRLKWNLPTNWKSAVLIGAQDSSGDLMVNFHGTGHDHGEEEEGHDDEHEEFEEGIANRPLVDTETRTLEDIAWSFRWENQFKIAADTRMSFGLSAAYGSNATGDNGYTFLYGADLKFQGKMKGHRPDWVWQTEYIRRKYHASAFDFEDDDDPSENFSLGSANVHDWGAYTMFVKNLAPKWSAGLRADYVSGSGNSFEGEEVVQRNDDENRSDRWRLSPLLIYHPNDYFSVKFQYSYDDAKFEGGSKAHLFWLGFEILLGGHSHKE